LDRVERFVYFRIMEGDTYMAEIQEMGDINLYSDTQTLPTPYTSMEPGSSTPP